MSRESDRPRMTPSRIPVEEVYAPESARDLVYERDLGSPGAYPFTRGIYPSMYRSQRWTMRQYAGFGTAAETNRRFRYLLEQGQTGLSVAFDLPTQMGYDSDHSMAEGEVGKVGVAIDSLEDMEELFGEIPLDRVSTSMTINATAPILLALYVALADSRGFSRGALAGTVQNDILKEYIARGTYIYPPAPSLRLAADVMEFSVRELPRWNPISVSGYHMREAGATAVEEVAFALANGLAYLEAARSRGLPPDTIGRRLSFFFASHSYFLEEVAKFRAARRLWARLMRERGATDPRAMTLRFHTQTGGVTLAAQQPQNNIVRVTVQALAAVLGGTQSLHTNSYDEALSLPSEEAATIALRTQQILAYETGVADTADPLGGSWAVEALTDRIEEESRALLDRIEGMGGACAAMEQGFLQQRIHHSAYEAQRRIETEEDVVVGVNRFRSEARETIPIFTIDPALERRQIARLTERRTRRDSAAAERALADLAEAARGTGNLLPPIIAAVKARATLGEISDTLRQVFGTYREMRSTLQDPNRP